MTTMSQLDPAQIIKAAFDEASGSFKANIVDASASNLNVLASYQIAYSSINGSGGALYVVTTSTTALVSKILPSEQTGYSMSLYTGAAASETLLCLIPPGYEEAINVNIPAGTRLTLRATNATAPASNFVYIQLIG